METIITILVFITGVLVGFLWCVYLWVHDLEKEIYDLNIKIIELEKG